MEETSGEVSGMKKSKENDDSKIFPQKLMEILSDESNHEAIRWLPHGQSFKIINRHKMTNEVLPKYFPKAKYTSFLRKLNRWNFTRVTTGAQKGSFYNGSFRRGQEALCTQMYCNNARAKFAVSDKSWTENIELLNAKNILETTSHSVAPAFNPRRFVSASTPAAPLSIMTNQVSQTKGSQKKEDFMTDYLTQKSMLIAMAERPQSTIQQQIIDEEAAAAAMLRVQLLEQQELLKAKINQELTVASSLIPEQVISVETSQVPLSTMNEQSSPREDLEMQGDPVMQFLIQKNMLDMAKRPQFAISPVQGEAALLRTQFELQTKRVQLARARDATAEQHHSLSW